MHALIVPLAEMISDPVAKTRARAMVELPEEDHDMRLLDEEALVEEARVAADAAIYRLCQEDALVTRVDFHRVRALVEREVQVSRGGPVHLTPLYLYLASLCSQAVAASVVASVAEALTRLGLLVTTPGAARASQRQRQRAAATTSHTAPRRAVGTRAGWLAWA